MAESSSSSSSPSSSSTSPTSTGAASTPSSAAPAKQYIRASTDDNALEPDALRGSEHLIKQMNIQDDEQDRRDAQADASKGS